MQQQLTDNPKKNDAKDRDKAGERTPKVPPGVPVDLAHSVDKNGSLVTVPPSDWLICFVPGLQKQWWHKFVNGRHKHVYAMRQTDTASWILVEPWWTRLMVTLLPSPDAVKFLRWGASGDILRVREAIPGKGNQLRGWSDCAVLASFVLGRKSHTWTPHGLYRELSKEKDAKHESVEEVLVQQFTRLVGKNASEALKVDSNTLSQPLDKVLAELGRNIYSAFMDEAVLQMCHTSIIEAERFPRVAEVYAKCGLEPAIAKLSKVLEDANSRREVAIANCERAASQFIAMLRGNLHLEGVANIRPAPSIEEIDARLQLVVKVFLHGVQNSAN